MKIINLFIIVCSMLLFSSCIDEQVIVDNKPKPQGSVVIHSDPDSARIFFLGTYMNKVTPDSIMDLESGTFDVTLKLDGFRDTTFLVTVLNNHKTTKSIVMSEFELGSIYVESDPEGAQIYLSGTYTDKVTPDSILNIDPGVYSLALKLPGFRDTAFTVSVAKRQTAEMNVLLKDTLPEIETTIEYSEIQFGQLLFSFEFNRDIYLDEILSRRPGSENVTSTKFTENVPKGEERILIFNTTTKGVWYFTVKGKKTDGDKRNFEINGDIEVD